MYKTKLLNLRKELKKDLHSLLSKKEKYKLIGFRFNTVFRVYYGERIRLGYNGIDFSIEEASIEELCSIVDYINKGQNEQNIFKRS